MPVYEFTCRACRHEFELIRPSIAHAETDNRCPKCHSEDIERRWSSVFTVTSKKS